jgi:predicted TPR repeat methyltransferase
LDQRTVIGTLAVLVVISGIVGYVVGYRRGTDAALAGRWAAEAAPPPSAPPMGGGGPMGGGMPPGMPGAMPPGMPGGMPSGLPEGGIASPEVLGRIDQLKKALAETPDDHDAWVQLGNDYFDTHQRDLSVEAYGRALKLKPNDPNVLTDQGVMYRELGKFDEALANFTKASKVDPKHIQSLYNIGIVWAYDKNNTAKAAAAWKQVIQLAPDSPQAGEAKAALGKLGIPISPAGK